MMDTKKAKTVILGDVGVGKTSIIQRYCKGTFNKKTTHTLGVDFVTKKEKLENGLEISL